MFAGPLFGVFILRMFTRKATPQAAMLGGLAGAILGLLTVFAKPLGIDALVVGKLWPLILSFTITFVLGLQLSLLIGKNKPDALKWLWKSVIKG